MPTYLYQCQACESEQEITASYSNKPLIVPCKDCRGDCKQIPAGFSLGAGMYHQSTKSSSQKREIMQELRESYGIDSIQAQNAPLKDVYDGIKKDGSRIREQMKAGEEKNLQRVREQNEKNKPTPAQIKRFEANYHKKNIVPRKTKKK